MRKTDAVIRLIFRETPRAALSANRLFSLIARFLKLSDQGAHRSDDPPVPVGISGVKAKRIAFAVVIDFSFAPNGLHERLRTAKRHFCPTALRASHPESLCGLRSVIFQRTRRDNGAAKDLNSRKIGMTVKKGSSFTWSPYSGFRRRARSVFSSAKPSG